MNTFISDFHGVWLPVVTPFRAGALDEASFRRLIRHYLPTGIRGFVLAATTGEGAVLEPEEFARLPEIAAEEQAAAGSRLPLLLGLSGSYTAQLARMLDRTASWPVDGYLITCPYYTRPSQEGLYQHFSLLASTARKPVLIYNIPYRTGVNLGNQTMLRLAAHPNIVGVKDCCATPSQSFDLVRDRPGNFAVLTGEDQEFFPALAAGADGGIVVSAHVAPHEFCSIEVAVRENRYRDALAAWRELAELPRLLFSEPSPAPVKHWLWRKGLIDSPEVRLPMTSVSPDLSDRIDKFIARESELAA